MWCWSSGGKGQGHRLLGDQQFSTLTTAVDAKYRKGVI